MLRGGGGGGGDSASMLGYRGCDRTERVNVQLTMYIDGMSWC